MWLSDRLGHRLAEEIIDARQFVLHDKAHASFGDLPLKHTLIARVAEHTQVTAAGIVEVVLKRDVADEILREVLLGRCFGAILTANDNLESVIEQVLGQSVTVTCLGATRSSTFKLVNAKRDVQSRHSLTGPSVELRLQE